MADSREEDGRSYRMPRELAELRAERDKYRDGLSALTDIVLSQQEFLDESAAALLAGSPVRLRASGISAALAGVLTQGVTRIPRGTISFGELSYDVLHLELRQGKLRVHGIADERAEGAHDGVAELRDPDGGLILAGAHARYMGRKGLISAWHLEFDFDLARWPGVRGSDG